MITIGQKIYIHDCNFGLKEYKVDKIGKKYFYAGKFKIDINELTVDSQYSSNYKIYLDKKDYDEEIEWRGKVDEIRRAFNYSFKRIPLEKVRLIYNILKEDRHEN
jgi:hypothetical protein